MNSVATAAPDNRPCSAPSIASRTLLYAMRHIAPKVAALAARSLVLGAAFAAASPAAAAAPPVALPLQPQRMVHIDTRTGTWLSPDLSPDGRWIVFDLLGDLYRIDAQGGEAQPLTRGLSLDSQPVYSPDGREIAFVSDRSGAENLWIMNAEGSSPRAVTHLDDDAVFTSPAWSADGRSLFVSHYRAEYNGFELWQVDLADGYTRVLVPIRPSADTPRDEASSVLGAFPAADGRFLYFAQHHGANDFDALPEWTIVRRDLTSGRNEVLVSAPRSPRPDLLLGTAFRPAVSHDGRWLLYGARDRGETGLKLLDLHTREERWLAYPVQLDELQSLPSRDLLPRQVFSADDRAVILTVGGRLFRLDVATGSRQEIPFHVREDVPIGPATRQVVRQESGPVRVRIIQQPQLSPDGRWLAFSALGSVYTLRLDGHARPRLLTQGFEPSWSPDGRSLAFVRWTAAAAGAVFVISARGGPAVLVSDTRAYFTSPVFTPDGKRILALRGSQAVRMHGYMEYGTVRQCELVAWPADVAEQAQAAPAGRAYSRSPATVLASAAMGGTLHFGPDRGAVNVLFGDGLHAVRLDGSDEHLLASVTGPGWYFVPGRAPADDLRQSPDGQWLLAQFAQQLHVVAMPAPGKTIDITDAGVRHRRLTDVGADFIGWADGGRAVTWALGSTFHRRALTADTAVRPQAYTAPVELPRAVVQGGILLRGATLVTERGDERIADADLLIRGERIAALGPRGSLSVPAGTFVLDVTGKWIVPGFIDTHDHIADIRRGILDFEAWGPLANLAYGVTTAFDPSPLSIDMLAYEDAVDAGLMVGSRIATTGPALFSFNEFQSYAQVRAALSRYRDAYRLGNLKMYRTGNRRVRQWIVQAARELGLQPTTEGALSMKLDLSQILDGYAGNEHALTAVPLGQDMIQLAAQSGVAWTTTLQIANGGPQGQDYFIVRDRPADDPKLNRFAPRFVVDMKTRVRTFRELSEYRFPRIAASAAAVQRAGGLIGMGSHGEMPGLGFHWEMQAHVMGGMSPAEALHAGTIGAAAAIGRAAEFGSLEPGKFADLVILDHDPLTDIAHTLDIHAVMLGGRLRDGATLAEVWPHARPLDRRWYCDDRPPGTHDPCAVPY